MFESRAGYFEFHTDNKRGYKYYTFTPNPLCDNLKLSIDEEMAAQLAKAHRLLGLLEGMIPFLPNIEALESMFIYNEALCSCRIDKIEAPCYDVLDVSQKTTAKTLPARNYYTAMQDSFHSSKINIKNSTLYGIHKSLMNGTDDECQGRFRTTQTLFCSHTTEGFPNYNPPPPKMLGSLLRDLECFTKTNSNMDVLIMAALAHYQFEALHPFVSGNGRTGRILVYMLLAESGMLSRPLFCLSKYLCLNKAEYFDRIDSVHSFGRYEQWIKFFLSSVIHSADEALARIKAWLILRKTNIEKINGLRRLGSSTSKLYECVERFPIADIGFLSRETGMAYNTVADAVKRLVELGVLSKTNAINRNRDFSHVGILDCFFNDLP